MYSLSVIAEVCTSTLAAARASYRSRDERVIVLGGPDLGMLAVGLIDLLSLTTFWTSEWPI